jgi:hypothetical protein
VQSLEILFNSVAYKLQHASAHLQFSAAQYITKTSFWAAVKISLMIKLLLTVCKYAIPFNSDTNNSRILEQRKNEKWDRSLYELTQHVRFKLTTVHLPYAQA